MSIPLFGQYPELNSLPQICAFAAEENGVFYKTKVFVNGFYCQEGESRIPYFVDDLEEACDLTKGCIQQILKEYSKVFVRVYPELRKYGGKFGVYMRLAF